MGEHSAADQDDQQAIDRERGWLESLSHLARNNGLNHAGLVEGAKMVAASREWFAGISNEPDGPEGMPHR